MISTKVRLKSIWRTHAIRLASSRIILQGCTLWCAPGSVNMRRKNCVLLPAAGRRTQYFHLIFTEPGKCTLAHPCSPWCRERGKLSSHVGFPIESLQNEMQIVNQFFNLDVGHWGGNVKDFAPLLQRGPQLRTIHKGVKVQWSSKKAPAKFGEGSSIMAAGRCIGCPRLVDRIKAGNSNMQEYFLY